MNYCKECRHYRQDEGAEKGRSADRCQHDQARDPVNGRDGCCYAMRKRGVCGRAGALFEPVTSIMTTSMLSVPQIKAWLASPLRFEPAMRRHAGGASGEIG